MSELKVGDVKFSQAFYDELYSEIWNAPELNAMKSKLSMHHLRGIVNATVRVIKNHKESLIPEGFAIVPIEPDANILLSLCDLTWNLHNISSNRMDFIRDMYKAMINAAPKPRDK